MGDLLGPRFEVEDGFGSRWLSCVHPLCNLHAVRPGKVQCDDWCEHLTRQGKPAVTKAHVDKLIQHAQWDRQEIRELVAQEWAEPT